MTSLHGCRRQRWSRAAVPIGVIVLLLALAPAAASAATITPNILTDEDTANLNCSLREAVTAANTDGNHNGCVAVGAMVDEDADTIVLQSGQTYSLSLASVANDDMNLNGDLDVRSEPLTIQTSGAARATIDANGDGVGDPIGPPGTGDRAIELGPTPNFVTSVTLSNLEITDGAVNTGAGVWASGVGTFSLTGSRVFANHAGGNAAGAIRVDGATTITNSTLEGNSGQCCGAIFHELSSLTITGSTITDSTSTGGSSDGGGIYKAQFAGTLTITNSTMTGNSTPASGGAIATGGGTVHLRNATITGNTADSDDGGTPGDGGGVLIGGTTTFNARNSIIADNSDESTAGNDHEDCSGTLTGEGYNLIENTTGCTLVGGLTGNVTGMGSGTSLLASNGGPTQTQALGNMSPALNAGNPALPDGSGTSCPATDQRGQPRGGLAGFCDIGAFERQPPVLDPVGNKTVQAGQNLSFVASATDPDPFDLLAFSASNLPAGAGFDTLTRTFSWTPSAVQVGSFPGVGFEVSDGTFNDDEAITITVTPVPQPSTPTNPGTSPGPGTSTPAKQTCKKKKKKRSAAAKKCKKKKR